MAFLIHSVIHYSLILLFTAAGVSALLMLACCREKTRTFYLSASLCFSVLIVNELQIYFSEVSSLFPESIGAVFIDRPILKSVILFALAVCILALQNEILRQPLSIRQILLLFVLAAWLLALSAVSRVSRTWEILYILPYQLFYLLLGLHGLRFRKHPDYSLADRPEEDRCFLFLSKLTVAFAILIFLEDTYSAIYLDRITLNSIKVKQRNFSEDVLHIVYAAAFLRYAVREIRLIAKKDSNQIPVESPAADQDAGKPASAITGQSALSYPRDEEPAQMVQRFGTSLHLTEREQDILDLLLDDKNNQEISETLYISLGTVKTHVHNIFQKADVVRRSDLIKGFEEFGGRPPERQ